METDVIEVKLSVEVSDQSMIAHLVFRNKSERNIYANKQLMYYDGMVLNDYFEIKNSKGVKIRYLGVMSNCTRMPDEYIQLGPGEIINTKIVLNEAYELKGGESYRILYDAINPSYQQEHQQLIEMQSNQVEISYK
jgi:hypothetical protein